MADDVDVHDLGPQDSKPLERLVRDALSLGADDAGDSTRIVLKPTPQQRADLDWVRDITQARSQTVVMMDALEEYKLALRLGSSSLGCITMLDAKLSALEEGTADDRAQFQRFATILSGYQRTFAMFTILHEAGKSGMSKNGGADVAGE